MFAPMTPSVQLSLNVFGELELTRGGEREGLPRSKKTRALLAYLAATGRPHRREHLCSLLWEDTDDPQGNLRWSLTKLRSVIDDGKRKRLVANEKLVELDSSDIQIDAMVARRECAGDLASVPTDRLEGVARSFRGEFLEGLDLPDSQPFHAWCVAQREEAQTRTDTCNRGSD
jgi:DNA-binding SARP family transcriptional activator